MKDLDLAGHPGLQNHEEGKDTDYEHEEETPFKNRTKQKTIKQKKKIKKGTSAGSGFIRIATILVIIIGIISLGYYLYNNHIQRLKPIVQKTDKENIREGTGSYTSREEGTKYIQVDSYIQNIKQGELYLSALTKILSNLPSKILIISLQCSNYNMEGKIYYIEKSNATQFEKELIVNFPAISIKNYELNKIEDVLPFRWSAYMYLDIQKSRAKKNIDDRYRAFSDKQLSNIINTIAAQRDINLRGFRISSKEENTVRKFRITGQSRIMNLCTFFNGLASKNTNLYFRNIKIYTDKSKGNTTFQIDGNIYPGK